MSKQIESEQEIRIRVAHQDVRIAQRRGSVVICGTTRGSLEVSRGEKRGEYVVRTLGIDTAEIARGQLMAIVNVLAPLYVVETAA